MYLKHWKYRQLAIALSPATVPMLLDADIISLDRCICKHWKYRQLAIILSAVTVPVLLDLNHWKYRQLANSPSPALAPVLVDADIIGLNRCI